MDSTLALARELIARPSVTPDDAGCQPLIAGRLQAAGFRVENLRFGNVDNLWAVAGNRGPLLCFAGHTDVVPPGPADDWHTDPFDPHLDSDRLTGRGAADMKGSVAAMVTAAERFRAEIGTRQTGRLALLLTSDEEGPARDGTRRVIETLTERGDAIDWCVVGEPSSNTALGDTIRHGRRGSMTGHIRAHGRQGHVAYPDAADNALHRLMPVLTELAGQTWDAGDADFPPTSFQISNLQAGTGADNVIPGRAEARFNLRFSPALTPDAIKATVDAVCRRHALACDIDWHLSGEPFITRDGALLDAVSDACEACLGSRPVRSTGGGTSDGRFIAPTGAQVVELGPVNATIHQANEWVSAADLTTLSQIFEDVMRRLLGPAA
ncbi:succinyl-diaminopimelate desuccinylase [Salinisphaera sp. P385]|uniref:Succinyl-diaminopimelate desuccinylase n=1 Tax=Spectribacter acetivorans TaxID=3075603 RepID=A0ABU3B4D6_9GAMM|nr:succinyl-diaminopimelate desuccinylase [Salinisphaera sp. P385]MDT0617317.1 succinyl-diaminopimelate desuccinylase [Salinisphaera sp. P385]